MELAYDDTLIEEVARRCTEVESGARNVDNILTNTLLPEVSRLLLERIVEGAEAGQHSGGHRRRRTVPVFDSHASDDRAAERACAGRGVRD